MTRTQWAALSCRKPFLSQHTDFLLWEQVEVWGQSSHHQRVLLPVVTQAHTYMTAHIGRDVTARYTETKPHRALKCMHPQSTTTQMPHKGICTHMHSCIRDSHPSLWGLHAEVPAWREREEGDWRQAKEGDQCRVGPWEPVTCCP